jgi:hypothetical protein
MGKHHVFLIAYGPADPFLRFSIVYSAVKPRLP